MGARSSLVSILLSAFVMVFMMQIGPTLDMTLPEQIVMAIICVVVVGVVSKFLVK